MKLMDKETQILALLQEIRDLVAEAISYELPCIADLNARLERVEDQLAEESDC